MRSRPLDVVVLGAGPAGLATAWTLLREHRDLISSITIVERANSVGGLARSHDVFGGRADFGPHAIGLDDPDVADLFTRMIGAEYDEFSLRTAMLWNGAMIEQPIRPFAALKRFGMGVCLRAALSVAASRMGAFKTDNDSFINQSRRRHGGYLSSHCIEPYARRLWGEALEDISGQWIPGALKPVGRGSVEGGTSALGSRLVVRHPRHGIGALYMALAESIRASGCHILLNTAVSGLLREGRRVVGVCCRGPDGIEYQLPLVHERLIVVSTIPLGLSFRLLRPSLSGSNPVEAELPRFRGTAVVYSLVDRQSAPPFHITYVNEPSVATGRVTNYSLWSRGMQPTVAGAAIVGCEYWMWPDELRRVDSASLSRLAACELQRLGLRPIDAAAPIVVREPASHPVPTRGLVASAEILRRFLSGLENLVLVGRGGAYRYADQDRILIDAIRVGRAIGRINRLGSSS